MVQYMAATAEAPQLEATEAPVQMLPQRCGSELEVRAPMRLHLPQKRGREMAGTEEMEVAVEAATEAGQIPHRGIRTAIRPDPVEQEAEAAKAAPAASCSTTESPRLSSPAVFGAKTDRSSLQRVARLLRCEVST